MSNCYLFVVLLQFGMYAVIRASQVPCYFIFGDSLVDSGNNNNLKTMAKANYMPYGIDFPEGVTGRFTNGRTMADLIGELLDFDEFIPPYVTATTQQISKGVNYGSGGSGIRRETGSHLGRRISLERQLGNHNAVVSRIRRLHGNSTFTNEHLNKCIYLANIGSNDYIQNYLKPKMYNTSRMYSEYEYARILVRQYSQQLKRLYNLGARKIVVFGLAPIGCTPGEISNFGAHRERCVESINHAVKPFNDKLKPLVDSLNRDNKDAKFTFINMTHISSMQQVSLLPNVPCCKVRADGQCAHSTKTCSDRAFSLYYDDFHSTEYANYYVAIRSYIALSHKDASPYHISHLARL